MLFFLGFFVVYRKYITFVIHIAVNLQLTFKLYHQNASGRKFRQRNFY